MLIGFSLIYSTYCLVVDSYFAENTLEYQIVGSDMTDLSEYLRSNRKEIVDLINKKYIPSNVTNEPTFHGLATKLQELSFMIE